MAEIGRNHPCPCGSGKKYKRCCLLKDDSDAARLRQEKTAIQTALDWLHQEYADAVESAIEEGFFADLEEEELDLILTVKNPLAQSIQINIAEWLLCDAELIVNDQPHRSMELLFREKSPRFSAVGAEWLQKIAATEVRLYRIEKIAQGKGLWLLDLQTGDSEPLFIPEAEGSRYAVQGSVLGARVVETQGQYCMTGAMYPLADELVEECLEGLGRFAEEDIPPLKRKSLQAELIISYWLGGILALLLDETQDPLNE